MFIDHNFIRSSLANYLVIYRDIFYSKQVAMGNICCQDDEPPRPRINIQPVAKQVNDRPQVKRSSSAVKFDNQKNMLEEYPLLVSYIRGNGEKGAAGGYVKFYVNGKISFDQVGEYYHGILVEDNGG